MQDYLSRFVSQHTGLSNDFMQPRIASRFEQPQASTLTAVDVPSVDSANYLSNSENGSSLHPVLAHPDHPAAHGELSKDASPEASHTRHFRDEAFSERLDSAERLLRQLSVGRSNISLNDGPSMTVPTSSGVETAATTISTVDQPHSGDEVHHHTTVVNHYSSPQSPTVRSHAGSSPQEPQVSPIKNRFESQNAANRAAIAIPQIVIPGHTSSSQVPSIAVESTAMSSPHEHLQERSTVTVSIGRIEIRTPRTAQTPVRPAPIRTGAKIMTLDEYAKSRRGGHS